jgi:cation diffusion facilitator family transporter
MPTSYSDHTHNFDDGNPLAERNTKIAVALTAFMMAAEILGGWLYNSMALLADGWHMGTHALALGLAVVAYGAARHYASDGRFAFGTWKIEVLGGYTSALFLLVVAALMLYHSIERLINPSEIHYDQAIIIAMVGLVVNLICAWLLKDNHTHEHDHHHEHHHDLNLRAAYMHVLADALTSVLAIIALFSGKLLDAAWLDPVMGIVGSVLVALWANGLIRETACVLLDANMDDSVVEEIREVITQSPIKATITDLHVWRVGRGKYSVILSLSSSEEVDADYFKRQLSIHEELVHITVELNKVTYSLV